MLCVRRGYERKDNDEYQNRKEIEMPKGYEKMRDKFIREGMTRKAAQRKAARIWNAKHKGNTVGRGK